MSEKVKHPVLWATLFTIISLAWVFPIVLVVINSFKQKAYISRNAFSIPTGKAFVGLQNYTRGIKRTNLIESFGWTVVVTVGAVLLILLCTSMCAWWIVRVNNRTAKSLYLLFLFNMIVPFQMVMFTLSKIADMLGLNTPWGLWIVYLGFGAGLAVFIFTGVIKGIPQELEESAMIDGASVPRIFFHPAGHVDLERFPPAVPDVGHAPVQDHVNRHPVPQGWLWLGGYGCHDGLPRAGHHPDYHLLPRVPEVHHQGCDGWRRQGLTITSRRGASRIVPGSPPSYAHWSATLTL